MSNLSIRLTPDGLGEVLVDGKDVSSAVRGITFRADAGDAVRAQLEMVIGDLSFELPEAVQPVRGLFPKGVVLTVVDVARWSETQRLAQALIEILRKECGVDVEVR